MPNGNVGTFHRGRIKLREENTDEILANAEVWASEFYEVHIRKKLNTFSIFAAHNVFDFL